MAVRKENVYEKGTLRYMLPMLDPAQCRAARGLLDWTQADLAKATGLSSMTVRAFEGGREARDSNRVLMRVMMEKAGVEFIDPDGGGSGVRFRENVEAP